MTGIVSSSHTRPMVILCFGDSVTVGVREGVTAEQTYPRLLEAALARKGVPAWVLESGRRSETTAQALLRLPELLGAGPEYLTIMYGLNDAAIDAGADRPRVSVDEYAANLDAMITLARERNIIP